MNITSELSLGVGEQKEKAENIYCSVVEQLLSMDKAPDSVLTKSTATTYNLTESACPI